MWVIPTGRGNKMVLSHTEHDITKKATRVLSVYGGLEGLARMPAWLISEVLSAFFTDQERREIVRLRPFRGAKKDILRMLQSKAAS
jgi:hypothetical protein